MSDASASTAHMSAPSSAVFALLLRAAAAASVGDAQPFRLPPVSAPAPSTRDVDFDEYETLDDNAVYATAFYWLELLLYFVAAVLVLVVVVRGGCAMACLQKAFRRRVAVPLDIGAQKRAMRGST